MRIILPTNEVFAFAGIWSYWNTPEGNTVHSFSIITTAENEQIKEIHDRMPVILTKEPEYKMWLGNNKTIELKELMKPYQAMLDP